MFVKLSKSTGEITRGTIFRTKNANKPHVLNGELNSELNGQSVIYDVKPGISGIGSIVFRDEEKLISDAKGVKHEYYKLHIAPYKGELEIWYLKHQSFYTDTMLIFLTAWVILFPKSDFVYRIFRNLPERPKELS